MGSKGQRILTLIAVSLFVLSVGTVVFISLDPSPESDPFTEFYVLGPNGSASNYPTELATGETGRLVVGIANHEHETTVYTVAIQLDGRILERRTARVASDDVWRDRISFVPRSTGRLELRLLLYRGGRPAMDAEPYRRLRLWIDVSA